jgi:ATP-independent RNA helicase DbpA
LIFCNFKASARELVGELGAAGLSVERLDGDLDQAQRTEVLARFRNQSLRYLVATDVAGRGLDVEGLDLVINFELPKEPEVYVHRIGRTGRAGREGLAISLASRPNDERIRAAEEAAGSVIEELGLGAGRGTQALLRSLAGSPRMATIRLLGGRRDKLRPGDILGALTGKTGRIDGCDVGKIEVHERVTFVAIRERVARDAARSLDTERIKKRRFRATLVGGKRRSS